MSQALSSTLFEATRRDPLAVRPLPIQREAHRRIATHPGGSGTAGRAKRSVDGERLPEGMTGGQLDRRGSSVSLDAAAERGGVGEDQRLAFPAEPEVGIEIAAVEIVPELPHHFPRIAERTEEGDLRHPVPLALHPVEDAAERLPALGIGDLVRDVEDDHVDVGVGEHLGVLAEDALIVRDVIAEDRLAPVMRIEVGAPQRAPSDSGSRSGPWPGSS